MMQTTIKYLNKDTTINTIPKEDLITETRSISNKRDFDTKIDSILKEDHITAIRSISNRRDFDL